jgi:hypothetical protein
MAASKNHCLIRNKPLMGRSNLLVVVRVMLDINVPVWNLQL